MVPRKFVLMGCLYVFFNPKKVGECMDTIWGNLIFFIVVFLIVYIFCYYIAGRIKVPKEKNKDKTKGKKKEKQFKYTNEGKLMMIRYNLDEKKVDYRELLRWTSFCNAFVISLTCTIICNIPLKMYYQLAIGFVILFGLIYSIFEIVGRHLNKKWGKENGK